MNLQQIKQRFSIIGNSSGLNRAIEVALQVASTEISVLITGESGTGKEIIPQVIHQTGARKHGQYIAVNCGAIPEGTIDSELFGHEKGSFTGASGERKGYFEVANGGTIFLDEVAELPMQTQVRLLRVLETGEFIRVGSSKVIKTNVRVVAATNENMQLAIKKGKFREDLFYRLSTVPIHLPPLRERKGDINLLFRKFANDFSEKYRMPALKLNDEATYLLENYTWPGNIRQLKNITEQMSVIETERDIDAEKLITYLPAEKETLPAVLDKQQSENFSERELMYKFLFDMKNDLNELKKMVFEMAQSGSDFQMNSSQKELFNSIKNEAGIDEPHLLSIGKTPIITPKRYEANEHTEDANDFEEHEELEESLSLGDREKELIKKALEKHRGKRKYAAQELGISERTLYRKIKEFDIEG